MFCISLDECACSAQTRDHPCYGPSEINGGVHAWVSRNMRKDSKNNVPVLLTWQFKEPLVTCLYRSTQQQTVRETLRNFIGHSVLLGETFHRTEHISVWLWVYIVLGATLDISVPLEMRQIRPITYLSCRSDSPMNLADTAAEIIKHLPSGNMCMLPHIWPDGSMYVNTEDSNYRLSVRICI